MPDHRNHRLKKSWWLQSLPQDIVSNPPLEGSSTTDVTIIDGGYTGLSAGYLLKKFHPEMEAYLLESDICGYEDSGMKRRVFHDLVRPHQRHYRIAV